VKEQQVELDKVSIFDLVYHVSVEKIEQTIYMRNNIRLQLIVEMIWVAIS